jgi:hypothetical protein
VGVRRWLRRGSTLTALVAGGVALLAGLVLLVLDVTRASGLTWLNRHAWTSQMISNVVVVLATYLIVDRAVAARSRARWREAIWERVENLADSLYHFLDSAERDWLSDPRPLFPISERDLVQCIEALDDLAHAASTVAHVAPVSPELAEMLDYVAEIRMRTRAWEAAARREVKFDFEQWCLLSPYEKMTRYRESRFIFIRALEATYQRLSSDVSAYLGGYAMGATFEGESLAALEYARDTDWELGWPNEERDRKARAEDQYWRDRGVRR